VGVWLIMRVPAVVEQTTTQATVPEPAEKTYTIAAVGDAVCSPAARITPVTCKMQEVADGVKAANPDAVLLLGDLQYENGELSSFNTVFDKTWGGQSAVIKPTPGNHEYNTKNATGYYTYFQQKNVETGGSDKGYYAFSVGDWRIISLNSNCEFIGGCEEGSDQADWLQKELQEHPTQCTIAYWHHPVFSSGPHGLEEKSNARGRYFWSQLQKAGAELVLVGHDHNYERFVAQSVDGTKDDKGIRQFVVGTGGKNLYPPRNPLANNSEYSNGTAFGFLKLKLAKSSYSWEFVTIDTKVLDSGSGKCK
jgi:3',5'-cyclic AMP phosphodiesterase CpdA